MSLSVSELAGRLGGRLEGDGSTSVSGVASLAEAGPGELTFLANPKYAAAVTATRAAALIAREDWSGACPCPVIRVKDPNLAFMMATVMLAPPPMPAVPGVHPSAVVAPDVKLGRDVSIGPNAVVEPGVSIGDRTVISAGCVVAHSSTIGSDCRLYPLVSLREYTKLGDRVIVHNGAVIGSDGFGYAKDGAMWRKIPQVGLVEIGDDVEIGANTTVDRARFGKTVIGNGVKIDNLVQVAHNVRIGPHTAIAAQAGISGSTVIGAGVQLGGQAGVAGHLEIGDNSVVGGQAGVTKDVPAATYVTDFPAMPHMKAKRMHAHVARLPEMKKKLEDVEERVERLEGLLAKG